MLRYILKRLAMTIPVLIGATMLIFFMVYALPGDPIRALAGDRPMSPEVAEKFRSDYNLNDSLPVQYIKYVWQLLQGDLGKDFNDRPVSDTISQALPVTIKLTVVAAVFETIFGIAAGVLAGIKKNSFFDSLVTVSTTVLVSIPVFVLAFLGQYVFGYKLDVFPISGDSRGWYSFILPGLILASLSMAYVARLTRNSFIESMSADYIRTARAKGISNRRVIIRHGLRTSLIPVVTFIGADVGALLGGAIVTERVFNLNGLGGAIYKGVIEQQGPRVVAIVTIMVFFYILFNLIVDVLYALLDPRIRHA